MEKPLLEDQLAAIKEMLFQGRKIEAIKIHRKSTGLDLAQSKTAVEEVETELRATVPEKFTRSAERRGCLGVLLVFCTLTLAFVLWLVVRQNFQK